MRTLYSFTNFMHFLSVRLFPLLDRLDSSYPVVFAATALHFIETTSPQPNHIQPLSTIEGQTLRMVEHASVQYVVLVVIISKSAKNDNASSHSDKGYLQGFNSHSFSCLVPLYTNNIISHFTVTVDFSFSYNFGL